MDYPGTSASGHHSAKGQRYYGALPVQGGLSEAVGVFDNVKDLQECIRTLEGSAFPRHDISVMGRRQEMEEVFGHETVEPLNVMDNPNTPRQAPARPEEQTIGASALIGGSAYIGAMALALSAGAVAMPAMVGAAILGGAGGGAIGAMLARIMGKNYSDHLEEQIEKGGLLLWVHTLDARTEDLAMTILRRHHAKNVHIHTL